MFPLFTNIALLAGLAGVAAPILIHLLLRRKSQRLRFSTIQFFVKKDEQSMRKRKLRNLLLLAARVILFALIVLAFARPYLRGGGAVAALAPRLQVILLLDSSASMQAGAPGGQSWTRAKDLARKVLAGLQTNDRAALVSCSTESAAVSEFAAPSVVTKKLADLQPTVGSGELTSGLQKALKLLAVGDNSYTTTLYVISDLQRAGCQNLTAVPVPTALNVKVLDLGERFIPNISVPDLQLARENQIAPHAVVTSFSDENSKLKAVFKIDGKQSSAAEFNLAENATTNLALSIPALTPGWHSAELRLESGDTLAADDTRYATIFVPEPVHGLIVETRSASKTFQQESYFVVAALDPVLGTNQERTSRFACEKMTLENLAEKLKVQAGRPKVEFVIIPGSIQLSSTVASALISFVQSGGGLILFVNESVSANSYNTFLRDLLPGQLGKIQSVSESEAPWRMGDFNKTSPMFSVFAEPNSGNLSLPEFTHRFLIKANAGASVVAEFDDGEPFILQRTLGGGKVVLVNTSANTVWADWQKHKTFVPWLHATAAFMAGRSAVSDPEAAATFVSGTAVDFELGVTKQKMKLERPGGREMMIETDEAGRLRDLSLDTPGIYSIKDLAGRELRRFAVNFPASESSLSFLTPADFQQQLVRTTPPAQTTLSASLFGDPARGKELWRALLLTALGLMLVEPILANKTLA